MTPEQKKKHDEEFERVKECVKDGIITHKEAGAGWIHKMVTTWIKQLTIGGS